MAVASDSWQDGPLTLQVRVPRTRSWRFSELRGGGRERSPVTCTSDRRGWRTGLIARQPGVENVCQLWLRVGMRRLVACSGFANYQCEEQCDDAAASGNASPNAATSTTGGR